MSLHNVTRWFSTRNTRTGFFLVLRRSLDVVCSRNYNAFRATCSLFHSKHNPVSGGSLFSATVFDLFTCSTIHLRLLSRFFKLIRQKITSIWHLWCPSNELIVHNNGICCLMIFWEADWLLPNCVHTINEHITLFWMERYFEILYGLYYLVHS